jgi:hypothetical protein
MLVEAGKESSGGVDMVVSGITKHGQCHWLCLASQGCFVSLVMETDKTVDCGIWGLEIWIERNRVSVCQLFIFTSKRCQGHAKREKGAQLPIGNGGQKKVWS